MITKEIVGQNDHLYNALFADISENVRDSNNEQIVIRTLEDYFMNLETIVEWVGNNLDKTYYLRLPADEELFEINANTRAISIPSNYRNHGIAVVGDTFAETLWFKIDRYYDLQDLSLADIKIYWELPNSKDLGYSIPVFVDINSEARQLIFGWVIPEILTENAGDLKFAISFTKNDGEIYEFNTLTQSVRINKTLSHEISKMDNTSFSDIRDRLQNTSDIGKIFVNRPIYSIIIPDFEAITPFTESQPVEIVVSAYSTTNGAKINYTIYKNGNKMDIVGEEEYQQTADTEINLGKIYYIYNTNNYEYEPVSDPETISIANYYEKCMKFKINEIGSYQCKAIAEYTITNVDGKEQKSSSSPQFTALWIWEAPSAFRKEDLKFEYTLNGIIAREENAVKPQLRITYPQQGSTQQRESEWISGLYSDDNDIINAQMISDYDEAGNIISSYYNCDIPGIYYAKVTKKLNNETYGPIMTGELEIQNEAWKVEVSLAANQSNTVPIGSIVELEFQHDDEPEHSYKYQWYVRPSSSNEWKKLGDVLTEAPKHWNTTQAGFYKLEIKSTYKRSDVVTTTGELFGVYDFG